MYKITIGMQTPRDNFDTFKKAFLMMCYFINKEQRKKRKPIKELRISCWMRDTSVKDMSSIIYLEKAIEMAEMEGIVPPLGQAEEDLFRVVVDGKMKVGRYATFPEAFLNLCYEVKKKFPKGHLTADIIISSWIISPPRKGRNQIVYLDEAVKSAKDFGVPSPFLVLKKI